MMPKQWELWELVSRIRVNGCRADFTEEQYEDASKQAVDLIKDVVFDQPSGFDRRHARIRAALTERDRILFGYSAKDKAA